MEGELEFGPGVRPATIRAAGRVAVVLSDVVDAGKELLNVSGGVLPGGIEFVASPDGLTITFTGLASREDYETALGRVRYRNTADIPTEGPLRKVTVTVTDETDLSDTATTTLAVDANDAPILRDLGPQQFASEVQFEDEDFAADGRDSLYYVRALQAPAPAINGANLRAEYDEAGNVTAVNPCYGDYRTDFNDDCLAPVEQRAWSSPIYVDFGTEAPGSS